MVMTKQKRQDLFSHLIIILNSIATIVSCSVLFFVIKEFATSNYNHVISGTNVICVCALCAWLLLKSVFAVICVKRGRCESGYVEPIFAFDIICFLLLFLVLLFTAIMSFVVPDMYNYAIADTVGLLPLVLLVLPSVLMYANKKDIEKKKRIIKLFIVSLFSTLTLCVTCVLSIASHIAAQFGGNVRIYIVIAGAVSLLSVAVLVIIVSIGKPSFDVVCVFGSCMIVNLIAFYSIFRYLNSVSPVATDLDKFGEFYTITAICIAIGLVGLIGSLLITLFRNKILMENAPVISQEILPETIATE